MMNKVYLMENLDCANCAAKIEAKINAMPEVEEATITFATRQLRVRAENPDALLEEMIRLARSVEPDATITERKSEHRAHHHEEAEHHHHGECGCGHEHHHHEECGCDHEHHHHEGCGCDHGHHHSEKEAHEQERRELPEILIGAGLFLVGILLENLFDGWWTAVPFLVGYLILGWEVVVTAGKNLVKGHVLDENFLMSIATIGAFAIGDFAEGVGVMLFYRVGEFFEHQAVERSRGQIMDAVELRPEVVNRVQDETVQVIPAGEAKTGDLLLVRPGDRIPLDGTVISGESRLDTAPITGEPVPVAVQPGDPVLSGCVNTSGQLTIRVDKPLEESMVTRILNSVENAAASKPKIDRFITRFARIYTPVVVGLALCTAVIPSLVTGDWNYWVYTALSFLVMSCPCALVLSVPLAFFSGIGVGSKRGILFKGGLSIEAMAGIKAVVMDKTGTLTKGEFVLQQVAGDQELLRLCAGCERNSTHPIAVSIVNAAKERGLTLPQPEALEEIPGCGIRALLEGKLVLCGNIGLLERFDIQVPELPATDATRVLVAVDGGYAGYLTISDTLKPGAAEAIARLKKQGITTAMLTGDREESAAAVASTLGIDEVHARLLPQDKLERLQDIRTRRGASMFVGDGINDAPVLAGADVGAAMGSGADAAIEAADVVFMTSDVDAIPESLSIARETRQIAWQNVVFALVIKIAVMILGLCGYASMWMAVFADSGVAMLCVLNSIRVLYRKR